MSARYRIGDRVRVRVAEPTGHCRTPGYLRGKRGVVVALHGEFRDPEKLAYHKPGLPRQPLYMVRFAHRDVWPERRSAAGDSICADIFQHWLFADGD